MAVNRNPYSEWKRLRSTSDYRRTDTPSMSLVRQQLSQSEYLTSSNRVNPGPRRNTRATVANASTTKPLGLGTEDMWGWQGWYDNEYSVLDPSDIAAGLYEQSTLEELLNGNELLVEESLPEQNENIPSPTLIPRRVLEVKQSVPATIWTVIHNLGFYPSVELFNSSRREIDGDIIHLSANELRVEFLVPISGYVRMN